MTDMTFIHLHVHSNFSLLDGAAPVEALAEAAAKLNMEALALTDHDGLYGAVRFYQAAQKHGLKPIIGAELTVEPAADTGLKYPAHLVLLAENNEGYSNLCIWGRHSGPSPFRSSMRALTGTTRCFRRRISRSIVRI